MTQQCIMVLADACRHVRIVLVASLLMAGAACSPSTPEGAAAPDAQPGAASGTQGQGFGPGMGMGRGGRVGPGRGPGPGGPMQMCTMGTGAVSDPVREAVLRALDDERGAEAFYDAVNQQFGPTAPFARIERAEQRHAAALERLLVAHQVSVPPAPPAGAPVKHDSIAAACRAGVEAEKKNIALYTELEKAALPEDVKCVFEHLRTASQERHLPAFQACSGAP